MQSYSANYLANLAGPHTTTIGVSIVDAYGNVLVGANALPGVSVTSLGHPSSGLQSVVTVDRTQVQRRALSLYLQDANGSLASGTLLQPTKISGHYVLITAGIAGSASSWAVSDTFSLGKFAITTPAVIDNPATYGRQLQVMGADRSTLISRNTLQTTYPVVAGALWSPTFQALLNFLYPGLSYANFANILFTTPTISLASGDDAWSDAATQWAPACGCELYFNEGSTSSLLDDAPVLALLTDPRLATSVWNYIEGVGNTAIQYQRSQSDRVPNTWIRDGASTSITVPVRGTAYDANPSSPFWAGSPTYGVVESYLQDNLIGGQAQAQAEANGAMYLGLGAGDVITLLAIPNYALQINDVITVTRADAGLDATPMVIDSIAFPLQVDGGQNAMMTITGRRVWPFP